MFATLVLQVLRELREALSAAKSERDGAKQELAEARKQVGTRSHAFLHSMPCSGPCLNHGTSTSSLSQAPLPWLQPKGKLAWCQLCAPAHVPVPHYILYPHTRPHRAAGRVAPHAGDNHQVNVKHARLDGGNKV